MSPENADATDAAKRRGAWSIDDGRERELVVRVIGTDEEVVVGKGRFRTVDLQRPDVERTPPGAYASYWEAGPMLIVTATIELPPDTRGRTPLRYHGHDPAKVEALAAIVHEARGKRHIRATTRVTTERGWIHCLQCQDRAVRMIDGSEGWRLTVDGEVR